MRGLVRIVSLFLPHFFVAVLSRRSPADRRPLKYFLPYGLMRRRMRRVYGQEVGNCQRDCGLGGLVRFMLPYGLILWWDETPTARVWGRPAVVQQVVDVAQVRHELNQMRDTLDDALERMELLSLRAVAGREE